MSWPIKKSFLYILVLFFVTRGVCFADFNPDSWTEIKGDHFIVYYENKEDRDISQDILNRAESYYHKIAEQIGYARYQNYWTWEGRVKIYLFPDQEAFTKETGQPAWSLGFAFRDSHVLEKKMIVTYKQEEDFLDGVLPHEISHLIVRDFIGFEKKIPAWFDEGLAQLQEKNKFQAANRVMHNLVKSKKYLPLEELLAKEKSRDEDPLKVAIFYAQSISLLDFLINKYGNEEFIQLCKAFKDGKTSEEALKTTYSTVIDSMAGLEEKWLDYLQSN